MSPGAEPFVSAIVLAAGGSRRMGRPKQILPLCGKPILQHVVDALGGTGVGEILVVLGSSADEVDRQLELPRSPPSRVVVVERHADGMSASLRCGLAGCAPESAAAIVLLGDQPGMTPAIVETVRTAYSADDRPIARAVFMGDEPGHPVVFDRVIWPEIMELRGDRGARSVLARDAARVLDVAVAASAPADIDTPSDYQLHVDRLGGRG